MVKKFNFRALSTTILVLIVAYGFFKNQIRMFYAQSVDYILILFGLDPDFIANNLNILSMKKQLSGVNGWIIYYPTYLFLHLIFIYLLFYKNKRIRNFLMVGLNSLILLLVILTVIGKVYSYEILYQISYDSFQKLFGLPFILLFIEGGRILYLDVINNEESV
ncbi:MAG: hypothetical protein ACI8Q1_000080 [Parvicella sp.]